MNISKKDRFPKRPIPAIRKKPLPAVDLPPHSEEAERGVLGCVFLAAELERGKVEAEEIMSRLAPHFFYAEQHKVIYNWLFSYLTAGLHTPHLSTFVAWLKAQKHDLETIGGLSYLTGLTDAAATHFQFPEFLTVLTQCWRRRRLLAESAKLKEDANNPDISLEEIKNRFDWLSEKAGARNKTVLKIWKASELLAYKPPTDLCLVGDNEICMGYDGVALIAGPGSSGKSLTVAGLALAGATGKGTWMGRRVHRKFKTLILQAENGSIRMKAEIEALAKNHPDLDINNHIFLSEPPEGGLPFHSTEFRTAVRREVATLKPDLIVIDPWSQVAAEDAAKEVVDKLGEIRSCFPAGDHCPGLLIVAHTKKPRPEDVRRGRGLTYLISGSVALPNTARCVYVLLPWTDDPEDDRVYWCCPKLNNGQMYAASVWHRRFGTFFQHDPNTDPKTWGMEDREEEEARAIQPEDVARAFEGLSVLKKSDLAKRLEKAIGVGYSTVMRAITPGRGGYLAQLVAVDSNGWLTLKKEEL